MKTTRSIQPCPSVYKSSNLMRLIQPRFATQLRRLSAVLAVAAAALISPLASAQVTLPFYDPFPTSYGDGATLGSGASATAWTIGNSPGAGSMTSRSIAALSYPGLASSSGLGVLMPAASGSPRDRGVQINPGTFGSGNPTLYVSFLLNIQTSPSALKNLLYMRNSTGGGTPVIGVYVTPTNTLLLSKSSTTPGSAPTAVLTPGTTHLVVLRYKWTSAAAGDDQVALWLDPGSLGVGEVSVPGPTLSTTSGSDQGSLQSFRF